MGHSGPFDIFFFYYFLTRMKKKKKGIIPYISELNIFYPMRSSIGGPNNCVCGRDWDFLVSDK